MEVYLWGYKREMLGDVAKQADDAFKSFRARYNF